MASVARSRVAIITYCALTVTTPAIVQAQTSQNAAGDSHAAGDTILAPIYLGSNNGHTDTTEPSSNNTISQAQSVDPPINIVPKASLLKKLWQLSDASPMISTDRNSVTPHPNAVPLGVLQVEGGMTLDKFHRDGDFIAGETNLRLGTWTGGELRFQVPNYLKSWGFDGRQEGTTDILVGVKQEIEPPALRKRGLDLGVIAGTSLPTGSRALSTHRLDPFVQVIAFQNIRKHYTLGTSHSIFMPTEAIESEETGEILRRRKLTYQPTVILFRSFGSRIDIWGEYAGQFFQRGPSLQIMDFGGVWRPRQRHQVDLRFGIGLTDASPRVFIGFGYSVLIGNVLPW